MSPPYKIRLSNKTKSAIYIYNYSNDILYVCSKNNMVVGIAGPVSLDLLNFDWRGKSCPEGHSFPMISFIINELLASGIKVVVYTNSHHINEPQIFKDENITICVGRKYNHPGRSLFYRERKDLVKLMRENPADIINAQWSYEFAWAALDSDIPAVVTFRDHAATILRYFRDAYRFSRYLMNSVVLFKGKYFIANSHYMRELLNGNIKKNTTVVSNFYDPLLEHHFSPVKEISKTIVSVGNGFGKRKNIETGLRAFKLLRKYHPEYRYIIVGQDFEEGGIAHSFAKANQLDQNVAFRGYQSFDNVIEAIKQADILLHPSREESFGNTVLEALVMGTTVVAGKKSGNVPYLLDHGTAGVLCDVNSPEDISQSLKRIIEDKQLSESFRMKGHQFAKMNFSKQVVIPRLIQRYEEVLNKKA